MAVSYSIFKTQPADSGAPRQDGVAVSGTNTYYSDPWGAPGADGHSIQVVYSGTPTGTFTLWYSNKNNPDRASDTDWVQDSSFAPTNPAGAGGKFGDNAANFKANLKRLKYVNASGTGTIEAYVTIA